MPPSPLLSSSSLTTRFIDPAVLLRMTPLLSATAQLWFALDQYIFLRPFTIPSLINRRETNSVLPTYFSTFFTQPGVFMVMFLHGVTVATGLVNLRRGGFHLDHAGGDASRWYKLGIALTAAHFLFVPAVAWKVQAISDDESRGKSTLDLRKWLRVHVIRLASVDVPAWVCMLVGTLKTLQLVKQAR